MSHPVKVLFIAGERAAGRQAALNLTNEFKAMQEGIQSGRHRDAYTLCEPIFDASRKDLPKSLVRHRPAIVHFAGHGEDRTLQLLDERGFPAPVTSEDIVQLFSNVPDPVRLLV